MLEQCRLHPAAACQLFHQPQAWFVEASDTVWPGVDYLANAYHLFGNIRDATSPGGRQHCHAQCGLGVLRQVNGPPENVGVKLAPVVVASCATRQAQVTTERRTE